MTSLNHSLTGAAIALAIKRPELSIPLAFASHYALDMVPHFEARDLPKKWPEVFIRFDLIICALAVVFLPFILNPQIPKWVMALSMAAGAAPDFVWIWRYWRIGNLDKVFAEPMSFLSRWHLKIQWSETLAGILVELIWLAGILTLVIALAR